MPNTVFSAFINGAPVVYTVDQMKDVLGTAELERKLSDANIVSPDALAAVVDVHNSVTREQYAAFSQSLDDILEGNGPDQEAAQAARDAAIAARDVANVAADNAKTARDDSQAARDAATLARDAAQGAAGQSQTASDQSQAASVASVAANVKAQAAALAAADRVADAGGFAQTASGQATIATQQATAAGQAASTATSSADIATTKAGEAVASASRAVTSENNAASSQVAAAQSQGISVTSAAAADLSAAAAAQATLAGLPQTFDPRWWMDGVVYAANPSTYPNATGLVPLGAGYQLDGSKNVISSKFIIPVTAGNTYECTIEYEPAADTANTLASAGRLFLNRRDARGIYLGGQPGIVCDFTRGTKLTFRYVPTAGTLTVNALITLDVAGSTSAVKVLFKKFTVVDVTARDAATAAASASAGSADLASVKATEASQSATSASASLNAAKTAQGSAEAARDQAAQSKTDASGSASSAVGSASLAADAATKSGQSASGASTSAQSAAASATAAGQKASAANDSANVATTKAGEAKTSATAAATSETNAAGSANTASQSAALATQAKSDAAGFATASAGSASAASSKANDAGQSATAASQAKLDAQAARDTSVSSAGLSQQQAALATDKAAAASASADLSARRASDAGVALASINDASGAFATQLSATSQRVSTLSAQIANPNGNLLPNSSGETDGVNTGRINQWGAGGGPWYSGVSTSWGPRIENDSPTTNIISVDSPRVPCTPNTDYTASADLLLFSDLQNAYCYVDIVYERAGGALYYPNTGRPVYGQRNFGSPGFRDASWTTARAPADATKVFMRGVFASSQAGAHNNIGIRQAKIELGSGPYSAYSQEGTVQNSAARVQTTEIATADLYGRTSARLTLAAITSGGRAQFSLYSDSAIGAGWELVGNGLISGNLTIDGTLIARKFDRTTMSRNATSNFSGSVSSQPGQTVGVPWSLSLGVLPPVGRFIYEYVVTVGSNIGQQSGTYNNRPYLVTFIDDGGFTLQAVDAQGNAYAPRANGSDTILGTTDFNATFTASLRGGNVDTGIQKDGDSYYRNISATYTLISIQLRVTWVAI